MLALTFLLAVLPWLGASSTAVSRPWKPNGKALAQDYAMINDNRNGREVILIWWVVPQLVQTSPTAEALLDKYVLMGVVHAHVAVDGRMSFDEIDTLKATDGQANPLTLLTKDNTPPAMVGMVSTIKASFGQALGPLGDGMRWFVFDGGSVHACSKGRMSVPFAGETYTYDTPIPGCTQP